MWELDHKEGWAPKNWSFWIVVLEKTLESLLDSKEIKPVNPKGNQPWIFIGGTDAAAQYFGHPIQRADYLEKILMLEKHGRQKEKEAAEDEMPRQHHQFNGHEFVQALRQWRTEKPGMLQSMGPQGVGHNLETEQQRSAWEI